MFFPHFAYTAYLIVVIMLVESGCAFYSLAAPSSNAEYGDDGGWQW